MADNISIATATSIATDDVAGIQYQYVKLADGTSDSAAVIPGDAANGLDVDVTRLPAIPAGDNNIGNVDVVTLPALPAGSNLIGKISSVMVTASADLTQLITVTTAGTPVQGPAVTNPGGWILKADPANSGSAWFMFHGQTKALKGFPLGVGESMMVPVESLADLDFDADTNGNKVHAAKL